jgi:2-dehydro-3-deoxyphosphogluconate aldolase / (4S)-4-hydroxy-2-oxoglutarate aldolase
MDPVFSELGRAGLVPVIKIDRPQDSVPLAEALVGAGLPVMEITFRTAAAGRRWGGSPARCRRPSSARGPC